MSAPYSPAEDEGTRDFELTLKAKTSSQPLSFTQACRIPLATIPLAAGPISSRAAGC